MEDGLGGAGSPCVAPSRGKRCSAQASAKSSTEHSGAGIEVGPVERIHRSCIPAQAPTTGRCGGEHGAARRFPAHWHRPRGVVEL